MLAAMRTGIRDGDSLIRTCTRHVDKTTLRVGASFR